VIVINESRHYGGGVQRDAHSQKRLNLFPSEICLFTFPTFRKKPPMCVCVRNMETSAEKWLPCGRNSFQDILTRSAGVSADTVRPPLQHTHTHTHTHTHNHAGYGSKWRVVLVLAFALERKKSMPTAV